MSDVFKQIYEKKLLENARNLQTHPKFHHTFSRIELGKAEGDGE